MLIISTTVGKTAQLGSQNAASTNLSPASKNTNRLGFLANPNNLKMMNPNKLNPQLIPNSTILSQPNSGANSINSTNSNHSLVIGTGSSGGAGNAIVCFDNESIVSQLKLDKQQGLNGSGYIKDSYIPHIVSVEMLDIRKAKQTEMRDDGTTTSRTLIETYPGETQAQYAERMLRRISVYIPNFKEFFQKAKSTISEFKISTSGLAPIDDVASGEVVNVGKCVRSTIIAHYDVGDKAMGVVDGRIYNLPVSVFSIPNRAMSFWHEYFYKFERLHNKTVSSDSTQIFIGKIVSAETTIGEFLKSENIYMKTPEFSSKYGDIFRRDPKVIFTTNTLGEFPFFNLVDLSFSWGFFKQIEEYLNNQDAISSLSYTMEFEKSFYEHWYSNNSYEKNKKMVIDELSKLANNPLHEKLIQYYANNLRPKVFTLPYPQNFLNQMDAFFQANLMNGIQDKYSFRYICEGNDKSSFKYKISCHRSLTIQNLYLFSKDHVDDRLSELDSEFLSQIFPLDGK